MRSNVWCRGPKLQRLLVALGSLISVLLIVLIFIRSVMTALPRWRRHRFDGSLRGLERSAPTVHGVLCWMGHPKVGFQRQARCP